MKVLIISSTTWNDSNSFGNTFSNLFSKMNDVEIYNIACRHGEAHNSVVKQSVQMTDRSVLKSIYNLKFDSCRIIENQTQNSDFSNEISERARKNRRTSSLIIRDIIWKIGRWKNSKTLNAFLDAVNLDVIYLPIYASPYMCDVQRYIVDKLNVPVVAHISDDIYSMNPGDSRLARLYRKYLRKKIRALLSRCSYIEVFAETMKEEYEKIFGKPCYVIGKGINVSDLSPIRYEKKEDDVSFVYTGNIGDDRYRSLYYIGKALDECRGDKSVSLNIYSATPLSDEMQRLFDSSPSIKFHGAVSRSEVEEIQRNADYLVHVEGFSEEAIFATKMSFSTKIIDYLVSGKPMLAVGPYEVNSIKVLKDEGVAVVATTEEEIKSVVSGILNCTVDLDSLAQNVEKYLVEKRDIKKIQAGIKSRLDKLVEGK